jgi:replicative DNA helicase
MKNNTIEDRRAVSALLGSVLLQPSLIYNVQHVEPRHIPGTEGDIWRAMLECAAAEVPINVIALEQRLPQYNGQVNQVLTAAINGTPHLGDIELYAAAVIAAYERRRVELLGQALITGAHNQSADIEVLKSTAAGELLQGGYVADVQMADDLADADMEQLKEWAADPLPAGAVRGLPTGLKDLDLLIDGLWPGLFVLAARTSMGKTALAIKAAVGVARSEPVLYCTFEQSARYIWRRAVCTNAGIAYQDAKRGMGMADMARYVGKAGELRELPLGFYDGSSAGGRTLAVVTAAINRFRQKHGGLGLVVLDNLGHITTGADNTYKELGSVTKAMLQVASRLECTVLALHQLNRKVEDRGNKRPQMSDLRDSGYIEEDAVLLGLLYRDEYYNEKTEAPNEVELAIVKNKEDGRLGTVRFFRDPRTGDVKNAR